MAAEIVHLQMPTLSTFNFKQMRSDTLRLPLKRGEPILLDALSYESADRGSYCFVYFWVYVIQLAALGAGVKAIHQTLKSRLMAGFSLTDSARF